MLRPPPCSWNKPSLPPPTQVAVSAQPEEDAGRGEAAAAVRPCNLVQTDGLPVCASVCLSKLSCCPWRASASCRRISRPPSRPPRTNSGRQLRQTTRVTDGGDVARSQDQMRARTDKSDRTLLRSVVGPQTAMEWQVESARGTNADLASSPDSGCSC